MSFETVTVWGPSRAKHTVTSTRLAVPGTQEAVLG